MNKKKTVLLICDFILFILFIVLDQITKILAINHLKDQNDIIIIKNVFQLHYLENKGAAFGMLKDQKLFFVFVAFIILVCILFAIIKIPAQKRYYSLNFLLLFIASGAVGNMLDRLRFDYVVDFFYFSLIDFPVFNVADIYVTVATILLILLILFYYKEEDLKFLQLSVAKNKELEKGNHE